MGEKPLLSNFLEHQLNWENGNLAVACVQIISILHLPLDDALDSLRDSKMFTATSNQSDNSIANQSFRENRTFLQIQMYGSVLQNGIEIMWKINNGSQLLGSVYYVCLYPLGTQ